MHYNIAKKKRGVTKKRLLGAYGLEIRTSIWDVCIGVVVSWTLAEGVLRSARHLGQVYGII